MQQQWNQAKVWTEQVVIPTYGIGKPDKNPMFLEKRVYQGSIGKVYQLPVVDRILDEKLAWDGKIWYRIIVEGNECYISSGLAELIE